jgi:hypothetical protein
MPRTTKSMMAAPFNSVKVRSHHRTGCQAFEQDSLLTCQCVKYVIFYRMQIHTGDLMTCLVKKGSLEPTLRLLYCRPDICCAKNKNSFKTKPLTLFAHHNIFQHLLYHIQQSTLINWNCSLNFIPQHVKEHTASFSFSVHT